MVQLRRFAVSLSSTYLALLAGCADLGKVSVPDPAIIGKDVTTPITLLRTSEDMVHSCSPTNIHLDVTDGKISGIVADYPKSIDNYNALKKAIGTIAGLVVRDSTIQDDGLRMTIWRQKDGSYSIGVTLPPPDDQDDLNVLIIGLEVR